jgi:serine/threonine protein kinase
MSDGGRVPRLGRYELRGELGRGAMGVVYRAFDRVLEREVALKTMAAPAADPAQTERFLREARTAGALHHPNIVTIHDLGQASGTYFIAMELLVGRSLEELLRSGEPVPIARRLQVIARVCDGLDYAHRAGVVHRDIKPPNVFLASDGTVKILDFGIAKVGASGATRTGVAIGTVDYMSPEQVRGERTLDGRSDIFSTGVMLYELLFRRRPFAADDLGATLHRILNQPPAGHERFERLLPPDLRQVLERALDKRCEARYASASEMAAALDRAAAALEGAAGAALEARLDGEEMGTFIFSRGREKMNVPISSPPRPRKRVRVLAVLTFLLVAALATEVFVNRRSIRLPGVSPKRAAKPVAANVEPVPEKKRPARAAAAEPEPAAPPDDGVPTGSLTVLAMPWADIEWIENLDTGERVQGDRSAPARLELAQGRYRLRLVNPYSRGPLEIDAVVTAGEVATVQATLPGFDAAAIVREMLR